MQAVEQSKIGLLNDLHYNGSVEAMNRLYESISELNQGGVGMLVVMGDLINADNGSNAMRLLREVSALCDSFHGTVRYMPGNHDLDHLTKEQFYVGLGHSADTALFSGKHGGVSLICIDGNFSPDGREYENGQFDWRDSFVPPDQLEWLASELSAIHQPAVILSHQRVDVACMHAVRNYEAVLDVIRKSGVVKAVFQGHQHADDLRNIDETVFYTLSAHIDGAGPAVIHIGPHGIRLTRDYQALKPA